MVKKPKLKAFFGLVRYDSRYFTMKRLTVVFMMRCGSRLQKLTENVVYILTVPKNGTTIIVCNGRDCTLEIKIETVR